jgi:hypothetical protein
MKGLSDGSLALVETMDVRKVAVCASSALVRDRLGWME